MSPELQSIIALALVALASLWLIRRSLRRRRSSGCGSDCGCGVSKLGRKD